MPAILYLFADTNLFVQCRPLDQLDWTAWKEFDEVNVIVTRPVQSEIDHQKNKGSGRLGDRARSTSRRFRDIIVGKEGYKEIRDANPPVKLFIRAELRPSGELKDQLDYSERDDQLVGTIYAFAKQNPGADIRLLTHDTGPMATAGMVGISVAPIPDEWLLGPETTETEKTITALRSEVARLKLAEPNFHIVCLDSGTKETEKLEAEAVHYAALTDDEVSVLMARIQERFPIATDFGSREPKEREARARLLPMLGMKEFYTPATDQEIAHYRDKKYPRWLAECEKRLRELHFSLQRHEGQPRFTFAVANQGTRPGKDTLITVQAKGNFKIQPRADDGDDDDDENGKSKQTPGIDALPAPPVHPHGKWDVRPFFGQGILDITRNFERSRLVPGQLGNFEGKGFDSLLLRSPDLRRDPNGFYWKPARPAIPGSEFSLECEQWRHGIAPELFPGEIYVSEEEDGVSGALECSIHADNLSTPALKRVPIRISVKRMGAYERAKKLVADLMSG